MKTSDILIHLRTYLPLYTNVFHDEIKVNSLTRSVDTVTGISDSPHGISGSNNAGRITEAYTPFEIVSLTHDSNGLAFAETKNPNDLTLNYPTTLEIVGADQSEYNGEIISEQLFPKDTQREIEPYKLYDVENRKNFKYGISGSPVSPATGNISLIQKFAGGYNGWFGMTRNTDTEFSYQVTRGFESPAFGDDIHLHTNFRIMGAVSFERAFDLYNKFPTLSTKTALFVVMGAHEFSRDPQAQTDIPNVFTIRDTLRMDAQQNFSIYAFMPCKSELTAATIRDDMEDLAKNLYSVILKHHFPNIFYDTTKYVTTVLNHGYFDYIRSVYIHRFNFQQPYVLLDQDCFKEDNSVAFRDIYMLQYNSYKSELINQHVNLDDEPLDE